MVNDQVTMQYLLHTINVVSGDSEALFFLSVLFFYFVNGVCGSLG